MIQSDNPREILEYFEKLEDTFGTAGWKLIVEEAKAQLYQYQADVLEARTWEAVCELRGQVMQLSRMINMEEVVGMLKAQAEEQVLSEAADNADL